jgi:ribosomal protein S12 methylthiotransferase accessory factor
MTVEALATSATPPELVILPLLAYDSRDLLATVNRWCVDEQRTLLPVYFADGVAQVGPTVVPGKTACLQCLDLRLVSNIENKEAYETYHAFIKQRGRRYPEVATHLTAISVLVGHELLRVATGYEQARSHNGVLKLDLWRSDTRRSPVLRFPNCTVCSARARRPKYDNHSFATLLAQL